jgi:four helix bundle protein
MKNFRSLQVWQKSHQLVLDVYAATRGFPKEELFGLTSQIRRAAASVPANIAEGCGREGDAELKRFINIAFGSASELEYHLILAHDLGYIDKEKYGALSLQTEEVKRMLAALIRTLKADR